MLNKIRVWARRSGKECHRERSKWSLSTPWHLRHYKLVSTTLDTSLSSCPRYLSSSLNSLGSHHLSQSCFVLYSLMLRFFFGYCVAYGIISSQVKRRYPWAFVCFWMWLLYKPNGLGPHYHSTPPLNIMCIETVSPVPNILGCHVIIRPNPIGLPFSCMFTSLSTVSLRFMRSSPDKLSLP